jgi:protein phosphatase
LAAPLATYFPEIGSLSDVGRSRSNNQDNIGCVRFSDSRNILAVVADGMGGHQGGEVASRTAVETFQQKFSSYLTGNDYSQALMNAFIEANTAIYQLAQDSVELNGMGTTLVALAVIDGSAYYANTGDSRLYLIRECKCTQLSQDHTVVAEMVKGGLLTPEAAENHPDKHVITCAVGTRPDIKVEVSNAPLLIEMGDCFLLCSDGLYDLVKDVEITQIVTSNPAQEACKQLIDLANNLGGYDNISVVVIKIVEKPTVVKEAPVTRA